jgi:hypothetical protein
MSSIYSSFRSSLHSSRRQCQWVRCRVTSRCLMTRRQRDSRFSSIFWLVYLRWYCWHSTLTSRSAMSKSVRSISDKSFDSERLSFIARLSRVDDDNDEIIDADFNWDKEVVLKIERNDWLEMIRTSFALIDASTFSANELSSIENDENETIDRLRITIVSYLSSSSVKSTMYETRSKTFSFTNSIIIFSRIMFFLA